MTRYLVMLLVIPTATVAGWWCGSARPAKNRPAADAPPPPPPVALFAAADDFEVGEVWEQNKLTRTLALRNTSDEPVRVQEITCGCHGVDVTPQQFELPPGEAKTVTVGLDLGASAASASTAPRPFRALIRVRYIAGGKEQRQSVGEYRATVKPVVGAPALWWGGVYSQACGRIEKVFEASTAVPGSSLAVTVDRKHPDWLPTAEVRVVPGTDTFHIALRSPVPKAGKYTCGLTMVATTRGGEVLPTKAVTVEVEVAAQDVRAEPSEVYFGAVRVGQSAESRVRLTSISGRPVQVEKAESGEHFQVTKDGEDYRVVAKPPAVGSLQDTVRFTVRTDTGIETVALPVTAVGIRGP